MKRIIWLLLGLALCCFRPAAYAQDRKWDDALDRYERICAQCIELRSRAQAGEPVPAASLSRLMSELKDLRVRLQGADGRMSPSQRLRYRSIRMRYAELFPEAAAAAALSAPGADLGGWQGLPTAKAVSPGAAVESPSWGNASPGALRLSRPGVLAGPGSGAFRWGYALAYGGLPDGYAGVMLVYGKHRWGGYLKPCSTLHFTRPALSCRSDGTTASGFLWTTGRERVGRYGCTAGAVYLARPWLGVYAGAGYGCRQVLWEDASQRWALVEDDSVCGMALDAGLVVRPWVFRAPAKRPVGLCLMVGASGIAFRHPSLEAGVGVSF